MNAMGSVIMNRWEVDKLQLSEKQKKFVDFVREDNKKDIDVNDYNAMFRMIVLNIFQTYLIAENESDKKDVAWLIYSIRDDLKEKKGCGT